MSHISFKRQQVILCNRFLNQVILVKQFLLLSGQEASCLCLEGDDDDGEFDVSLLLQLSQNSRPEEHLTLTDTKQVRIQIQVLHLKGGSKRESVKLSGVCLKEGNHGKPCILHINFSNPV